MITKILGILDLLSGVSFALLKFGLGESIAWFFVGCIIIKALIFIKDFASIVDLVVAVFFILAIFNVFPYISWIFVFWLFEKGLVSLIS